MFYGRYIKKLLNQKKRENEGYLTRETLASLF